VANCAARAYNLVLSAFELLSTTPIIFRITSQGICMFARIKLALMRSNLYAFAQRCASSSNSKQVVHQGRICTNCPPPGFTSLHRIAHTLYPLKPGSWKQCGLISRIYT